MEKYWSVTERNWTGTEHKLLLCFWIQYWRSVISLLFWDHFAQVFNCVTVWYVCYLADHGHTGLQLPGTEVRIKHFNSDQLCFFILSSKNVNETIQLHHAKVLTSLRTSVTCISNQCAATSCPSDYKESVGNSERITPYDVIRISPED